MVAEQADNYDIIEAFRKALELSNDDLTEKLVSATLLRFPKMNKEKATLHNFNTYGEKQQKSILKKIAPDIDKVLHSIINAVKEITRAEKMLRIATNNSLRLPSTVGSSSIRELKFSQTSSKSYGLMTTRNKGAPSDNFQGNTSSPQDKEVLRLLGQLNIKEGILVKDQKVTSNIWKKMWAKSLMSGVQSGVSSALGAIGPIAGQMLSLWSYQFWSEVVKLSGNNAIVRKIASASVAITPAVVAVLGAVVTAFTASLMGQFASIFMLAKFPAFLASGEMAAGSVAAIASLEALKVGISGFVTTVARSATALAAAGVLLMGAWGLITSFIRGFQEGGLGEGLARGFVGIFSTIAKSIIQLIPGLGKFASGISDVGIESTLKDIGKIISLSFKITIKSLQDYLDTSFKKLFGNFSLFKLIKDAFTEVWKYMPKFMGGEGKPLPGTTPPADPNQSKKPGFIDKVYDKLTGKKENLANTMKVIEDFEKKSGAKIDRKYITGGDHNKGSGHYEGKKFDLGLAGKSQEEKLREYKLLSATSGVKSIGYETKSNQEASYKSFKALLEKNKLDTSKLKPYYYSPESSGEHLDVSTKMRPAETKVPNAPKVPAPPLVDLSGLDNSNYTKQSNVYPQTTSAVRNLISSDPTQSGINAVVTLTSR